MDICVAILTGRLTGVSERLTIHEFGGRAAVASSKAFHDAERSELDATVLSLNHVLDRNVRRAAETGLPSVRVRDLFLSNPQKNEFKAVPRLTNLRND